MIDFLKKYRSELLACALVAQILASPLADSNPHLGDLLALALIATLLAGASYVANRKIVRVFVMPLVGIWFIARAFEAFGDSRHVYTYLAPLAGFALSCSILWAILDRFDRIPHITSSVIAEAFICYLVIAIAFSQLFWALSRILTNPFSQIVPPSQNSTYLYFSMASLGGVGYSTILPINPYIRLVAALENMIGIFYIAVIVARLVSSYRSKSRHDGREADPSGAP